MVITDIVINTLLGRLTLDPAGMHCPAWDDAFVSSIKLFLRTATKYGSQSRQSGSTVHWRGQSVPD